MLRRRRLLRLNAGQHQFGTFANVIGRVTAARATRSRCNIVVEILRVAQLLHVIQMLVTLHMNRKIAFGGG